MPAAEKQNRRPSFAAAKSMPPIFVISLVRAEKRRADICARLDAADDGRKVWHQIVGGIVNIPEWCRRIFCYCAIRSQK